MITGVIGEVKRANTVGLAGENLVTWTACPGCGKWRWKRLTEQDTLCVACAARRRITCTNAITFFGKRDPEVGDVAQATTLGQIGSHTMFFDPCIKCGTPHWVRIHSRNTYCSRCGLKHTGPRRDRSSDGRFTTDGYVIVRVEKTDPLRAMSKAGGWVLEHRLIVARRIGRPLTHNDVIHHINGIRSDNSNGNLQLLTVRTHHSHLVTKDAQKRIVDLETRVLLLESEITLLKSQLESMPIPSQAASGAEGVETRRGAPCETGEGIVHSPGKSGDESALRSWSLITSNKNGVPSEQLLGKQLANSGKPKQRELQGNPELSGGVNAS